MYQVFDHTADLGLAIDASSLSGLFCEAGQALFSIIVQNYSEVRPLVEIVVTLPLGPEATELADRDASQETSLSKAAQSELEFLLFDYLSELLYLFESRHLLLREIQVSFESGKLHSVCRGEAMDEARHQMDHEVKAITQHALLVARSASGWHAEVIVDI